MLTIIVTECNTSMSVGPSYIVGPKCMLAASHAAP